MHMEHSIPVAGGNAGGPDAINKKDGDNDHTDAPPTSVRLRRKELQPRYEARAFCAALATAAQTPRLPSAASQHHSAVAGAPHTCGVS